MDAPLRMRIPPLLSASRPWHATAQKVAFPPVPSDSSTSSTPAASPVVAPAPAAISLARAADEVEGEQRPNS